MTEMRWRAWSLGRGIVLGGLSAIALVVACEPHLRPWADIESLQSNDDDSQQPMDAGSESGLSGPSGLCPEGSERELCAVRQCPADTECTIYGRCDALGECVESSSTALDGGIGDGGGLGPECPGCQIDGTCVGDGALNVENPCLLCDPARASDTWSSNDGVTCDDGLFCTVDDACSDGGCAGVVRVCEDGVDCNGVSTCDEDLDSCSPGVNQCGANAICDVATDRCASTCEGCLIDGVCLPSGAELAGNPCMVCDPGRSTAAFTAATGKSCGAGPSGCSQQDTCDNQGRCQSNHLAATTPCGNSASSECDQADSCDGNGNCLQRLVGNTTPCDDGAFCTTGDRCQGGSCLPTANRSCGANQTCNEAANACQCQPRARNCASSQDNDCDGRPDNTLDNVCTCVIGQTQVCGEHPGLDGNGPCRAGQRRCEAGANSSSSAFGACTGSVGPQATDSCSIAGNDANCNGLPNDACLLGLGEECSSASDCSSGRCDPWYADRDGDGFGDAALLVGTCGTVRQPFPPVGFVANDDDCCDADGPAAEVAARMHPGQTEFFADDQSVCLDIHPYDYDCDGGPTSDHRAAGTECTDLNTNECNGRRIWAGGAGNDPPCGGFQVAFGCSAGGLSCSYAGAASERFDQNFCK